MEIDIHITAPGKTRQISLEAPDDEYDLWTAERLKLIRPTPQGMKFHYGQEFAYPDPGPPPACAKELPHRNKPMLSIKDGVLLIEDCSCSQIALDGRAMKELYALLPELITIVDAVCSGTGAFQFGRLP